MTHKQALNKLDTLSNLSEVEELLNDIYGDYEEEITSSRYGYLEQYPMLERFTPDTKYRVYVEEVENV